MIHLPFNMRMWTSINHIHKGCKNKSSWKMNPPNKFLDSFKKAFKMILLHSKVHHNKHPNKEQWLGLCEHKKNPEIVIQKVDKGSPIVIMQTTDYLHEGYRQLWDKHFYTKLKEDPTLSISDKTCQVVTEMRNLKLITEKSLTSSM